MTAYYIEVGYNSYYGDRGEVAEKLKEVVADIREHPERLVAETLRIEPELSQEALAEYAASYKPPGEDLTISIDESDGLKIVQLASGGGEARELKEALRRAMCRLVIEAMHRAKMEINIRVS